MRAFQFRLQRTYACPIIPGTEVRIFALVKPASAYLMLKQKASRSKRRTNGLSLSGPKKTGLQSKYDVSTSIKKPNGARNAKAWSSLRLWTRPRHEAVNPTRFTTKNTFYPLVVKLFHCFTGSEGWNLVRNDWAIKRVGILRGKICCGFYSWALVKPFSQNVFRLLAFNTPNTTSCWAQISPFCWLIALRWGVLTVKLPVKELILKSLLVLIF